MVLLLPACVFRKMLRRSNIFFSSFSSLGIYGSRCKHRLVISKMFPCPDLSDRLSKLSDKAKLCDTDSDTQKGSSSSLSQKLMLQQKLILGASSGTFYLLPSITRSLEKLHRLIDEEMQSIGAQKVTMPCLAPHHLWNVSGRWEKMGLELFSLSDRSGASHCLAPTHEEAVTTIVASESPISYKRLPIRLYQIGRKFRDEARPKHGLLRCREFEMKDLYTFDVDTEAAEESFRQVCSAYSRLFSRLGLQSVEVDASTGLMGGRRSREFHLVSSVGEDVLFTCVKCGSGFNQELLSEKRRDDGKCAVPGCLGSLVQTSGIEVAHAFFLGTTYSETFKATFVNSEKQKSLLQMGCYGIGVTRLLSASIEVLSKADQLRWSQILAPHQVIVIPQKEGFKSEVTRVMADDIYDRLSLLPNLRSEVVIDDRLHLSIGQRIRQATASGFPYIVVLGKQCLSDPPVLEFINVYDSSKQFYSIDQLVDALAQIKTIVV